MLLNHFGRLPSFTHRFSLSLGENQVYTGHHT